MSIPTPRWAGPELIERRAGATILCPVYLDGELVAPVSGTVRLYRPDGTQGLSAPVGVVGSIATVTWAAPTLASLSLGEGYRLEWELLLTGDTTSTTFRRGAAVVRSAIYPVITEADLLARHSDLVALRGGTTPPYQSYLDTAWEEVLHSLRQKGSLPQLVTTPEDLRYIHMYRALKIIFRDFKLTAGDTSRWAELEASYTEEERRAWSSLTLRYDADEDGVGESQRAVRPVTFLGGVGPRRRWC